MSRIGNQPIKIPVGVTLTSSGSQVVVTGSKGTLSFQIPSSLKLTVDGKVGKITANKGDKKTKSMHGLTRSLINNALIGLTEGWQKTLQLVGVGFRAQTDGRKLTLIVGFSHPVEFIAPAGITFAVNANDITVSGFDKHLVGEITARIRRIKPPESYKGKGIRYKGERIKLKPGKAAKTVGGATTGAK